MGLRRGQHRQPRRAAGRLDHADGGAYVQPVHLFSILMTTSGGTTVPRYDIAQSWTEVPRYDRTERSVPEVARCDHIGQLALVVLFLVLIVLPLAANLAGRDGADRHAENREMAPFPRLDGTWQSIAGFGDAVAHWFEDHFGFRAALVRW